jgi:hypothetical protein
MERALEISRLEEISRYGKLPEVVEGYLHEQLFFKRRIF